jgi:CubicO group peptidase (beta-lactamase class C family)
MDAIQDAMRRYHTPGVAVGVLREGHADEITTYGVTSVDNPLPVQPNTLFQIGSITKTITATAVMRLVEQGRLDLEAPVRRYLPELRLADEDVAQRVTLRHLLTHTAGFVGDDFTDTGNGDDAVARYVANVAELPQETPLGSLFTYCNAGFVVVGRVIEAVTGQQYEQAARDLVLEPLGMSQSFFWPTDVMTRRFVVGHISPFDDAGEITVARPWALARAANPAGGLTSCVPDLLRYARVLLGQGPPGFLSRASVQLMQTPLAPAGNFADSVGVAWMLRTIGQTTIVEHSGGTLGQQTALRVVPEREFALVVLTNASRGAELHGWLGAALLRKHLDLAAPDRVPIDVPSEQLAEYVGRYESWLVGIEVTVEPEGRRLVIQVHPKGGFPTKGSPPGPTPPPAPFAIWSDDRIVGLEAPFKGAAAEFVRDDERRIAWLRFGGRLARRAALSS